MEVSLSTDNIKRNRGMSQSDYSNKSDIRKSSFVIDYNSFISEKSIPF